MDFYKYQAAGNDFVLVTSLESRADISTDEVIRLCDRRYGIGADGLIILEGSRDYDFAMRFFNNDGSGGMMCGNGGRCIVDLAGRTGIPASGKDGSWVFEAPDGIHRGRIVTSEGNKSIVCLSMNDITSVEPVDLPETEGKYSKAWRMNTGTDHLVMFRNDLNSLDVLKEGRRWRYDKGSGIRDAVLRHRHHSLGRRGMDERRPPGKIHAPVNLGHLHGVVQPPLRNLSGCNHRRTRRTDIPLYPVHTQLTFRSFSRPHQTDLPQHTVRHPTPARPRECTIFPQIRYTLLGHPQTIHAITASRATFPKNRPRECTLFPQIRYTLRPALREQGN